MTSMDHERCSELLGGYVRGDLPARESAAVESHLAECSDCSAEHRAVLALTTGAGSSLTEHERARLRAGILAQTPAARRSFGARIYPALGAAAVLIGLIAGGVYFSTSEGGIEGDALTRQAPEIEDEDSAQDGPVPEPAAEGGAASLDAAPKAGTSDTTALRANAEYSGLRTRYDGDAGDLTGKSLRRRGHRGEPFSRFSAALTVSDVQDVRGRFLDMILGQASDEYSDDIDSCARTVFEEDDTSVLAYAAVGDYRDEATLALGFVASPADKGRLDRYYIWLWPRGDCSFPREIFSGSIRPQ